MRKPLLIFLLLTISIEQLSARSPVVTGKENEGTGNSLARAIVSAVEASAGNITTATVKKKSRGSNNSGSYSHNCL